MSKARSHYVRRHLHAHQETVKLVLGTRRKWPRQRRQPPETETRPRRWQFFSRRDRNETLVRLETETSRPRPTPRQDSLHQTLHTYTGSCMDELIKFWNRSASGSGSRTFWWILLHCEIGHLQLFLLISLENDGVFTKAFITVVSLNNDVFVKFRMRTSDTQHIRTSALIVPLICRLASCFLNTLLYTTSCSTFDLDLNFG